MSRSVLLAGLLLCSLPLALVAADKEAKEPAQEVGKEEVIRCKLTTDGKRCCGAACTVNFSKELGLPLDYLSSIGHRISQARRTPDPVELAMAAQSLQVAEKVSGKNASITSEAVLKDAVDLAKMRAISSELAAVALVVTDDAARSELSKLAAAAKESEADKAAALKAGEETKELFGYLTVDNHTDECLRIFVSGRYKGTVHAGQRAYYHVHDHSDPTVLEAYCEEEGELVRNSYNYGHHHRLYWHID